MTKPRLTRNATMRLGERMKLGELGTPVPERIGRPVVVPGVDLTGMTDGERDRAMARWLFSGVGELEGKLFLERHDSCCGIFSGLFCNCMHPRRPGLIETDLRQAGARWWLLSLMDSMDVWRGATESLGLEMKDWGHCADDISSEAIEHAEALGL